MFGNEMVKSSVHLTETGLYYRVIWIGKKIKNIVPYGRRLHFPGSQAENGHTGFIFIWQKAGLTTKGKSFD